MRLLSPFGCAPARPAAGFTLLEVLVALGIVGVAVAGVLQLTSQSLRLLRLSSEHVEAVDLAERLVRDQAAPVEGSEAGAEGRFAWERRVALVETPRDLERTAGRTPQLFAISVAVRWGGNRTVEAATLRTAMPDPLEGADLGQPGAPGGQVTPQTLPGQAGRQGPGGLPTSPGGSRAPGSGGSPFGGSPFGGSRSR